MQHDNVLFFFSTDKNNWSKGTTFNKAFDELKKVNHNKRCKCVVIMTTDMDAYIDQISGGVCSKTTELNQVIGYFKLSQGRLTPIAKP